MTQHPIERLRNKLTPFFTLVELLNSADIMVKTSDKTILDIYCQVLKVCSENLDDIQLHLTESEYFLTKKSGLDYEKLSVQFDALIKSTTKEDLEKWLEMDRKRMKDVSRDSEQD
jgi:hypothetical protein